MNGTGQTYYDCNALDQHTKAQAILAAQAWSNSTVVDPAPLCPGCVCSQNGMASAVWCPAGTSWPGLGALSLTPSCVSAQCPVPGLTTTFTWH